MVGFHAIMTTNYIEVTLTASADFIIVSEQDVT